MISKLQQIPLREVWRHEALNFTTWLEDNIDVLNEALDINLAKVERERPAGAFSVDLVAEDDSGNFVIIENQLERSDHDHLGKLLTYLAVIEAKSAIWIVSEPRPEHVSAINWLNEASSATFYLVKVQAVKIGDSPPAALFTLIVGPSEISREAGVVKKEQAERHGLRRRFWTALLDQAKEKTKLHATIGPGDHNWIGAIVNKRGLSFNYYVRKHDTSIGLYIDRDKETEAENLEIFDTLYQAKERIETAFGEPLEWSRLDTKRACRIDKTITLGGYQDEANWPDIHQAMIEAMIRLHEALKPEFSKIKG
ncbi:MAG: DUF4268 domain-containing protein [Chloroflexota bacterium]